MEEILGSAMLRGITTALFVSICVLLIIVILLQKGRGGGLAGAFGGAGGHSAFGAKTGDVFTWVTIALTAMFILIAVIGNYTYKPDTPAVATPPVIAPAGPVDESEGETAGEGEAATREPATQPGS